MRQALKTYQIELKVCGPVFIGSGQEIQKKEYVFNEKETGIIDVEKLYALVKKKRLTADFERFMVIDAKEDLKHWAERNRISKTELEQCMKYKVHAGEIRRNKGRMQIMACIKDPYGNPYVPGSSLKGMLRTVLLCNEMLQHPEQFRRIGQQAKQDLDEQVPGRNRKQVLAKNAADMEAQAFHTLNRTEKKKDAVNDKMSAIIISDSEPLSVDDLILCQKWEHHQDGSSRTLNLLRECIKPGTVIRATMTVDETLISITADDIKKAVEEVYDCYYTCFQRKFAKSDRKSKQTVFLGGGSGFVSKTVLYSLLEEKDAVRTISNIFLKTGVPREHKHYQDIKLGVSPHVLKCTMYRGKEYMMGQCELKIT